MEVEVRMVGGWSLDDWRLKLRWLEVVVRMVGGWSKDDLRLE